MAEFQWWLLLVGLVAGGGIVAVVTMDGRRREEDLTALERRAEATWIADRMGGPDDSMNHLAVEDVLRLHREYLGLPPPDELVVEGQPLARGAVPWGVADLDGDPDREPYQIRHDRGSGADQDLAAAGEDEAPPGQEAYAGAHREQRPDR